jgi:2,3-dihydroxybiphenyl 1,2-dioxygenase
MSQAVAQLACLSFGVSNLDDWERFAVEVLGLQISERFEDGFDLRLDSHQRRFRIRQNSADDLMLVGWQAADSDSFKELHQRLKESGAQPELASEALRAERGVEQLLLFRDPAGIPCELALGHETAAEDFESKQVAGGFVAEELGLGHLVVTSQDQAKSEAFYQKTLGFGFSDRIACEIYGFDVNLAFFHTNERHHSLAVGGRLEKNIHHFLLEAQSMDEVGRAYDRCIKARLPIMNTLGRHPNDQMFSFYAMTPSGFQFEFGWGGRIIEPATHHPGAFDRISEWGHHPPIILAPRRKS